MIEGVLTVVSVTGRRMTTFVLLDSQLSGTRKGDNSTEENKKRREGGF